MLNLIIKNKKILGMNARNLIYIRPNNLTSAKRIADNKLLSKKIFKKNKLPTPGLIAKIENYKDLETFDFSIIPPSFVLKPTLGLGGEGILVVYGKKKTEDNVWIKADRQLVTEDDLRNHINNILDGSFSRTNTPDVAFFEERIKLSKVFKPYSYKGMPDVRVIVYNNVPVMAMLRLATKESGGRANLQLGGIGCGVDMATGRTTTAVQGKSKIIEYTPGIRLPLSGLQIPYWNEILEMAVRAQQVTKIGFLGADIALDRDRGPVFLELNARPGLSIQIANMEGLLSRLKRVEGLKVKSIKHGIELAKNLFGGEIEEEIEELSGKKIISTVEKIKLIGKDGKEVEVEAKIDTGAGFTSIGDELAEKLGFEKTVRLYNDLNINYDKIKNLNSKERTLLFKDIPDLVDTAIIHSSHGTSYRPMIKITIVMDGLTIPAKVTIINRSNLKYPVIIGKNDLKKFLVEVK